jgi:tetratricopeptide (TPR) repeat protein
MCYGATKKDYKGAIEWYKKCIEQSPSFSSPYSNIGVKYEQMLKYEEARTWYYKAIEIRSFDAAPHNNLTNVYITLNWSDKQIEKEAEKYDKINKA